MQPFDMTSELDQRQNANRNSALEAIERSEQVQAIDEEIDRLPESYRSVIVLHHLQGHSRSETAKRVGATESSVKARLERGRRMLRGRLVRRGITLSAIGALNMQNVASAAIPETAKTRLTEQLIAWRDGSPLNLSNEVLSDALSKEIDMMWLQHGSTKWIAAAAVLLVIAVVVQSSSASGGKSNASGQSHSAVGVVQPPVINVAPSSNSEPVVAARSFVAQASHSEPTVSSFTKTEPASSVGNRQQGLPDGTWKHTSPFGELTITVEGNALHMEGVGSGEFAMFRPAAEAEYSVASDGTIYGLIHNIDMGISIPAMTEMDSDLSELMPLMSLNDMPFSARAYNAKKTLVLKSFAVGAPSSALGDEASGSVAAAMAYASVVFCGSYEKSDR